MYTPFSLHLIGKLDQINPFLCEHCETVCHPEDGILASLTDGKGTREAKYCRWCVHALMFSPTELKHRAAQKKYNPSPSDSCDPTVNKVVIT